jgi:hypothetical protein
MAKHILMLVLALASVALALFVLTKQPLLVPQDAGPVLAPTVTVTEAPAISTTPTSSGEVVAPGKEAVTVGLMQRTTYRTIAVEAWAVTEDSRCPSDVQCIWAGRAVAALNVYSLNGELVESRELEEGSSFVSGSTRITLERIRPYPVSTKKTPDGEYRFDFIFEVLK